MSKQNKIIFCFVSYLVEKRYFDSVEINFLLAGHTHSKIDQFFSILSKAIAAAQFIGTPLALEWLLKQAPCLERDRPRYYRLEVK